jgi:uncharacterized membrane protein YvbJ
MVYRCERCGKPHARDDPPCTDCGHDSFKQYDEETSATVETGPNFVWACNDCGRQHVKHTPPCSRCGSQELEKIEPSYEQLDRDLERRTGWKTIARPYVPLMVLIAIAGLGLVALIAL